MSWKSAIFPPPRDYWDDEESVTLKRKPARNPGIPFSSLLLPANDVMRASFIVTLFLMVAMITILLIESSHCAGGY